MRFLLIDQITHWEVGQSLTAVKKLTGDEDYLQDHFPNFPVMPGVLMLEAMYQAAAWLVRKSEDFANSIVVLTEARNVKYQDFVEPGQILTVTAEILKQDERTTTAKAAGTVDGNVAVSGRLILERSCLTDLYPDRANADVYMRQQLRQVFDRLAATDA